MPDLLGLTASTFAGVALGALFFGGLWWTVQRGLTSRWPASLFLGSVLARMGVTLGGFWLVSAGQWPRLVACVLGFTAARLLAAWLMSAPARLEVRHASES